jgi:PAS domain S-box-containing protein
MTMIQPGRAGHSITRAILTSTLVFLLLVPLWLWFIGVQRQQRRSVERSGIRQIAQLHATALRQAFGRVELELQALKGFCEQHLSTNGDVNESAFATFAEGLIANSALVRTFQLVKNGVIVKTCPLKGNESVVGYDLYQSPVADVAEDVRRAYSRDVMTVTGPLPLIQGVDGLIIRQRIGVPTGFPSGPGTAGAQQAPQLLVAAVIDMESLIEAAGVSDTQDPVLLMAVRKTLGSAVLGPQNIFAQEPVIRVIALPEGNWDLAVVPAAGWSPWFPGVGSLVVGFSGLAVCLVTLLVYAVAIRNSHLAMAVQQRTEQLVQVNQQLEDDLILRKATEARLRENESRLKSLFDTEPACIKVVSRGGTVLEMNRAGLEMLECDTSEQVINQPVFQFIAPEFQTVCQEFHSNVMSGSSQLLEFQIISRTGKRRWVESRAIPMTDAQDNITCSMAITRDITETRTAQEALRKSEQQFRSMFEQAAVGVVQYDSHTGRILNLNDRLCEMLNRQRESLRQELMQDVFGRGFQPVTLADQPQRGVQESGTVLEIDVALSDSASVWVRLTSSAPSRHAQDYGHVTTIVEDVTQQRLDSDSLVQRDAILNSVAIAAARLLTAGDPLTVVDSVLRELGRATRSSRVYYFSKDSTASDGPAVSEIAEWCADGIEPQIRNPMFQGFQLRKFGFQRWDDLFSIGQPVRGRVAGFPEQERELLTQLGIKSLLVLPVSLTREWRGCIGFDDCVREREWSDAEMGVLQIAAETLAAAIERQKTETQRNELIEQLAQSQKLEAVGQLAGGVAHDFNNMLQVILGYSDIGMTMSSNDLVLTEILTEIRTAAQRSAEMTQQLLTFARRQLVEPSLLDLNRAIPDLLKLLQRMVGENIRLRWIPGASPCSVKMDPSQLDQILTNLVLNARDAIPGTGTVAIATSLRQRDDESELADTTDVSAHVVELTVSDDGCGMSSGTQSRVFEPFFTTKAVGEGSGLGLSNVYGIVQQNQGTITVKSEEGHGTTFFIQLPVQESDAAKLATNDDQATMPCGTETIVLVEDEPMVLDFGAQLLRRLGYSVITFRTPLDALANQASFQAQAELLISDVVMPEMDGGELARLLTETSPQLRCLFISGFAPETFQSRLRDQSGPPLLFKPFSAQQLAEKVREVLD